MKTAMTPVEFLKQNAQEELKYPASDNQIAAWFSSQLIKTMEDNFSEVDVNEEGKKVYKIDDLTKGLQMVEKLAEEESQ